jgi:hypothetical protein
LEQICKKKKAKQNKTDLLSEPRSDNCRNVVEGNVALKSKRFEIVKRRSTLAVDGAVRNKVPDQANQTHKTRFTKIMQIKQNKTHFTEISFKRSKASHPANSTTATVARAGLLTLLEAMA